MFACCWLGYHFVTELNSNEQIFLFCFLSFGRWLRLICVLFFSLFPLSFVGTSSFLTNLQIFLCFITRLFVVWVWLSSWVWRCVHLQMLSPRTVSFQAFFIPTTAQIVKKGEMMNHLLKLDARAMPNSCFCWLLEPFLINFAQSAVVDGKQTFGFGT